MVQPPIRSTGMLASCDTRGKCSVLRKEEEEEEEEKEEEEEEEEEESKRGVATLHQSNSAILLTLL